MAAQLFNRIGQVGLGMALVGGVVNSALYNGTKPLITTIKLLLKKNITSSYYHKLAGREFF